MLAIAGAGCLALAARADPTSATAAGVPARRLATMLWSPRRVPAVVAHTVEVARLRRDLGTITAPFASCVAVDDADGSVTGNQTREPLAGASTQKLLVAAAALAALGPQHRFTTRAVATTSVRGGTLGGDLTIMGGGDPMLSTASAPSTPAAPSTSLPALADEIARAGVRRIDGALVADDTRYDRSRAVPDWKPDEIAEGDVGALGALIVNGGRDDSGIAAADPALATVQQLAALLSTRGVQITGGASDPGRAAPAHAREIASVSSPPLSQIVEQMLTVSNDETAELLTREIGRVEAGTGSTPAGTAAIPKVLARLGVPGTGVTLHDGSGLAPDDRVTCAALSGVLALTEQARYRPIRDGLAIAGRTGTLADRLLGTSLVGRLRAKTGHIDGVVGLAGMIEPLHPSGSPVRFAFIANGAFSTDQGSALQDQVAEAVGTYLDSPAPVSLVPAPG